VKDFHRDLINFPELEQVNAKEGLRYYIREGSDIKYPSVTTVLNLKTAKFIMAWRKRVGEEEANRISTRAANRGTAAHNLIEKYIKGEPAEAKLPLHLMLFDNFRRFADEHLNNIRVIEGRMFSDHLKVAGTADIIAEVDGELAIVDWKTSAKKKTKSQMDNYYMQQAAYAVMFEENTRIPVSKLVTVVSTEEGDIQVVEERRDRWIGQFRELRERYFEIYNI